MNKIRKLSGINLSLYFLLWSVLGFGIFYFSIYVTWCFWEGKGIFSSISSFNKGEFLEIYPSYLMIVGWVLGVLLYSLGQEAPQKEAELFKAAGILVAIFATLTAIL